ncbi:hypothetical protein GQX74_007294 [Glossina fuscipes]|nr:hypothetical protein GQX74_007294 [Glossina fuscipes]
MNYYINHIGSTTLDILLSFFSFRSWGTYKHLQTYAGYQLPSPIHSGFYILLLTFITIAASSVSSRSSSKSLAIVSLRISKRRLLHAPVIEGTLMNVGVILRLAGTSSKTNGNFNDNSPPIPDSVNLTLT